VATCSHGQVWTRPLFIIAIAGVAAYQFYKARQQGGRGRDMEVLDLFGPRSRRGSSYEQLMAPGLGRSRRRWAAEVAPGGRPVQRGAWGAAPTGRTGEEDSSEDETGDRGYPYAMLKEFHQHARDQGPR
jgi:hypothetical protein